VYASVCTSFSCQSINQRSSQSHTRAEEKPHNSATSGVANPVRREATQAWGAVSPNLLVCRVAEMPQIADAVWPEMARWGAERFVSLFGLIC